MESLIKIIAILFYFLIQSSYCSQYGLELEILTIKFVSSHRPWQSLQYDIQIEARNDQGITHALDTVTLTAVLGQNSELIFPEIPGRNPYAITRINAGDTLCFKISQASFERLVEECYKVKEEISFYQITNFNVTMTEGSTLYYKWSQHLLKDDEFTNSAVADNVRSDLPVNSDASIQSTTENSTGTIVTHSATITAPVCNCQSCTVAIVFACIEGVLLIPVVLFGIYYAISKFKMQKKKSSVKPATQKATRPPIVVIRSGDENSNANFSRNSNYYDDSGVSSVASFPVSSRSDNHREEQNTYNDVSEPVNNKKQTTSNNEIFKATPLKTNKPSTMALNDKIGEASASLRNTLASTGQSLGNAGRKLKEKINEKKPTPNPPMPPPRDYRGDHGEARENPHADSFDDDDDLYDVIELEENVGEVPKTANDNALLAKKTLPSFPAHVPVNSFVHKHKAITSTTDNEKPKDASIAREKGHKFSYT